MATSDPSPSLHAVARDTPIALLDCKQAFASLLPAEQKYAHYLAQAGWEGSLIVLLQTSPESPYLFLLLHKLFSKGCGPQCFFSSQQPSEQTLSDFTGLLWYAAQFFSNMGNYQSFGDSKFIPGIARDKLWALVELSQAYAADKDLVTLLWSRCNNAMYSLEPKRLRELGFPPDGVTTYYSENIVHSEAELIQKFMDAKHISAYNTRLFKHTSKEGASRFELQIASVDSEPAGEDISPLLGEHSWEGTKVRVTCGDYSPLLRRLNENLEKAREFGNELEKEMLKEYIRSFQGGSIEVHKRGSGVWVGNKGPVVETYIGFIESYRDPLRVRGEFEGFVAVVNKQQSLKFSNLVEDAESMISQLPWPKEFERDSYHRPDFTSLDVLSYASSGVPLGINIPNYDDVRQAKGFKNVSLGNVLTCRISDKKVSFLAEADSDLLRKYHFRAFEMQVGLHELMGHGSGKLFREEDDGSRNFDPSLKHPLTGQAVTSWYKAGETFSSRFKKLSSSYEECRAECVGLYLCFCPSVLSIFGFEGKLASDVVYANWLVLLQRGVQGLEYYSPDTNQWRQAHMQARFVILRLLIAAGVAELKAVVGEDGNGDLLLKLDRDQLEGKGRQAIGDFLKELQVHRSLGEVVEAEKLYNGLSSVDAGFMKMREIVLARKDPRGMLIQPQTVMKDDGTVEYREFPCSPEGVIDSYTSRFSSLHELQQLAEKDRGFWTF